LVRWTLRAPHFDVHAFSDPKRAIVRVLDIKPDLIICDMMMPTMDGQTFLRLVKRIPELSTVPFLFLTAVRLGSEVDAALKGGADAYLVKPFPLAKLRETVERVLEAAAAERPPVHAPAMHPASTGPDSTMAATAAAPGDAPIPIPDVLRVEMEGKGATVLSGTALAPPERPHAALDQAPAGDEAAAPAETTLLEPVYEGRFSTLERGGSKIQVTTEAASSPNFVITTVISVDNQGLRKVESFWSHPLRRQGDFELVRRQIDLQHDRAIADARREPLVGAPRDEVWPEAERGRTDEG
jgi:CheY-like chemotaxis protein